MGAGEPAWTFYGRQECACCEEAARLTLRLLAGHAVTVRMIEVAGPEEAPAFVHRLPALFDAHGRLLWQGAFDSRVTEGALAQEASKVPVLPYRGFKRPPRPAANPMWDYEADAEPVPNGLQNGPQ